MFVRPTDYHEAKDFSIWMGITHPDIWDIWQDDYWCTDMTDFDWQHLVEVEYNKPFNYKVGA